MRQEVESFEQKLILCGNMSSRSNTSLMLSLFTESYDYLYVARAASRLPKLDLSCTEQHPGSALVAATLEVRKLTPSQT